jgi:DNA-binding transcriptional ArsR family regulator
MSSDRLDLEQYEAPPAPAIFGTEARTRLLLLIAVLDETYPGELSRYAGMPISSIQRTLDSLERQNLIATRQVVVRGVRLNPTYPAVKELRAFLLRVAEGYPQYYTLRDSIRRRPRRRKKSL